jgi:riboflavin kinase
MIKFQHFPFIHLLLQIAGTDSWLSRPTVGTWPATATESHPRGFQSTVLRLTSSESEEEIIKLQASVSQSKSKALTIEDHLSHQQQVFDNISDWFADREKEVTPELEPIYKSMAREVISSFTPNENSEEEEASIHILDVACGTGVLWEFLLDAANKASVSLKITGVDLSPSMVDYASVRAKELTSDKENSKHEIEVVTSEILSYCQTLADSTFFDGVILNACFANFYEPRKVLESLPGEAICISHPLGSNFIRKLHNDDPKTVPHLLPDSPMELAILTHGLPLVLSHMSSKPFYLATLQKTRAKGLEKVHRYRGCVDQGYGRGGKKLGVPTANLPASLFQDALEDVATGVYFGWTALESEPGKIFKAVVNVGYSPTFEGKENLEKIIEAHLILDGETLEDFYGASMRLQLVGFLREEKKFDSFPELVSQINADISDANAALDMTPYQELTTDDFLKTSVDWIGNGGGDEKASWEFSSMIDSLKKLPIERV